MKIFFSADHHFCHNNIIKYSTRPFQSCEEHDKLLVDIWNHQVRSDDIVYYLGDIALGNPKFVHDKILSKLNGRIFLIKGNHDSTATNKANVGRFEWVKDAHFLNIQHESKTYEIHLSHYGHRVWNKRHYGSWHLFAHSHGNLPPYGKSFDVGVDNAYKLLGGYRLFTLEDVISIMGTLPLDPNEKMIYTDEEQIVRD